MRRLERAFGVLLIVVVAALLELLGKTGYASQDLFGTMWIVEFSLAYLGIKFFEFLLEL